MRILLFLILSAQLYGLDPPVSYWGSESEAIPKHWESFLSPDSLNFWKEGDYTPPLPQIWAMRDPTPQNIGFYKTYLKRRASMLERFQLAMKEEQIHEIEKIVVAFRSDCSACHQLLSELGAHPQITERVQLLQVDNAPYAGQWSKLRLSEEQAHFLNIQTVPVVWVQKKGGSMLRLETATKLFEEYL